jgi:anti-sigma factor RsiW
MTHLNDNSIEAYIQGILPPAERQIVDQHAKSCSACRKELVIASLSLRISRRIADLLNSPEGDAEAELTAVC